MTAVRNFWCIICKCPMIDIGIHIIAMHMNEPVLFRKGYSTQLVLVSVEIKET